MKQLLSRTVWILAIVLLSIPALAQKKAQQYGEKVDVKKAIKVSQLPKVLTGKGEAAVVVKGIITEVCQAEGCWLKLKNDKGEPIFVKIKDHAFLLPKDIAGKMATVSGVAVVTEVSVEELKHYAEDAGKSEEEIASIHQPSKEIRIHATGIVVE